MTFSEFSIKIIRTLWIWLSIRQMFNSLQSILSMDEGQDLQSTMQFVIWHLTFTMTFSRYLTFLHSTSWSYYNLFSSWDNMSSTDRLFLFQTQNASFQYSITTFLFRLCSFHAPLIYQTKVLFFVLVKYFCFILGKLSYKKSRKIAIVNSQAKQCLQDTVVCLDA